MISVTFIYVALPKRIVHSTSAEILFNMTYEITLLMPMQKQPLKGKLFSNNFSFYYFSAERTLSRSISHIRSK